MECENGSFALHYIEEVCKQIGPRKTTTDAETKCAEDLAKRLKPYCSDILLDNFTCIPDLYPCGLIKVVVIIMLSGLFTFLFSYPLGLLAVIIPIVGLFFLYYSMIRSKEWLGVFFPKGVSHNVIGKITSKKQLKGGEPAKLKVIIAGHIDSAVKMDITRFGDKIPIITIGGIGYGILALLLAIIKVILVAILPEEMPLFSNDVITFTVIDIIFLAISIPGIPLIYLLYKGYRGTVVVQGANDNLSGVGVTLALAKYFSQESNRLENIELWVGAFGAEESGDRGSHAFVKKYGPLGELDNSITIIPESIGGGEKLGIIKKENMHMAIHNEPLAQDFQKAYEQYAEECRTSSTPNEKPLVPCDIIVLKYAGTDGSSFSLAGFTATSLLAYAGAVMKPINWHDITDIPENCDPKMMEVAFQIYSHYLKAKDKKI